MTISKEIIEVLDYLGEKLGMSIDWTNQNVLPYVQELMGKYINYEIATSIAWIVITSIVIGIATIIVCKTKDEFLKEMLKNITIGLFAGGRCSSRHSNI